MSSSSSPLIVNRIIIHVSTTQTSNLHKQLLLEMGGNSVTIKSNMESSVSGLYVIGDANNDVFISKQGYLDRFSSAMVAAAGGDEDFYSQIEDLKFQNGDDIEQMYKVLGG
ncbi:unnamed protein product [Aspergillus oryzae]|uniref:Unnamed protein product n=2 Tax=Aspergillus oryzae TaxID=5062 RepID=A0AAN4YNF6_ASPOZ|nr:unnamed protein product [Aspergillus oryzae]GMF86600.1 unnamed protein product [Aspergillus oryzae]GMG14551.1 unnamed protein product [Aspergillus oryzae]GMG33790.1 unnamed protein product [Aspergillus oryzae]GMG54632.1 unnamed protein product [Aspergillus oryzae var. brunneus]